MNVASRILEATVPRSMTAVIGRPASGVSTLLARICATAAEGGTTAVLASWERSSAMSAELVGRQDVELPEILGWDVEELGRCPEMAAAGRGAVIVIDYLQLIVGTVDRAAMASALRSLAADHGQRMVLGVMAPHALEDLQRDVAPARAVRTVGQTLGSVLGHADAAAVITGADAPPRRVSLAVPSPHHTAKWLLQWTAILDQDAQTDDSE